jgi:hypothetical protein
MNLDRVNALKTLLPNLAPRDRDFASSLIDQYARRSSLSDKQWPWVDKLIEKAQPKPEPVAETIDLTRLLDLFNKAAANLQRPRVAFACSAGEFEVSRAGDNSRNPGHLYVKAAVSKDYLGKVDPKGKFHAAGWAADNYGDVFQALDGFAADPAGAAAAYGKATGICCFCSRGLTDARSVTVGYGPICADKWGLPWGE